MESFSPPIVSWSPPPSQNHRRKLKSTVSSNSPPHSFLTWHISVSRPRIRIPAAVSPERIHFSLLQHWKLLPRLPKSHIYYSIIGFLAPLPCIASETVASTTEGSNRINLESIVISIDDFFNRNPFFVAGCTFIWLVVLPVVEYNVSKYKYVSAIDAFRKLRDDPNAQLLDIREKRSLAAMESPNLKYLKKGVVKVEFLEGREEEFVRKVVEEFEDPGNTVLCVLDNFDGNSMKVAELLFKNGFKEAYAIKGGVRGEKGWLAIQETLLPPSVRMYPKKKPRPEASPSLDTNGVVGHINDKKMEGLSSPAVSQGENQTMDSGNSNSTMALATAKEPIQHSLSPYPNYPDLKPPTSPTPSKPEW